MVTGIVIPHETNMAMQKVVFRDLADYQRAVGGYIETVHLDEHPLVIVANEQGKINRLPVNRRATCLWWLLNPTGIGGDVLVGDVVILGGAADGDMGDVPKTLIGLLLESKRFQVEVRLSTEFETWMPIGDPVDEFFEATVRALQLMEVWRPAGDVRVVAVE